MSANPKTKKARRADGVMSPEDLAQAIAAYKTRRAERLAAKAQADQEDDTVPVADLKPAEGAAAVADGDDDTVIAASGQADGDDIADQVQMVKDRRDRRDEGEEPADKEAAMGVIAQQDGDMDILFDIIDTLLAERDFDSA